MCKPDWKARGLSAPLTVDNMRKRRKRARIENAIRKLPPELRTVAKEHPEFVFREICQNRSRI